MTEITNTNAVPLDSTDLEDRIAKRIVARAWGAIPAKKPIAWLLAAVGVLGGGGIGLRDYVPFTLSSVWASKGALQAEADERKVADDKLHGRIDRLPRDIGSELLKTLRAYEEEKAAKRRKK